MSMSESDAVCGLLMLGKRTRDAQDGLNLSPTDANRVHELIAIRKRQLEYFDNALDTIAQEFAERQAASSGVHGNQTSTTLPIIHTCFGASGGSQGNGRVSTLKRLPQSLSVMHVAGLRMWPFANTAVKRLARIQAFLNMLPANQVSNTDHYFWSAPGNPYLRNTNAILLMTTEQCSNFTFAITQSLPASHSEAILLRRVVYDFMNSLGFVREEVGIVTTFYFSPGRWNSVGHRLCPSMKTPKTVIDKPYTQQDWDKELAHLRDLKLVVCIDTRWLYGRNAPVVAKHLTEYATPTFKMTTVASPDLMYSPAPQRHV